MADVVVPPPEPLDELLDDPVDEPEDVALEPLELAFDELVLEALVLDEPPLEVAEVDDELAVSPPEPPAPVICPPPPEPTEPCAALVSVSVEPPPPQPERSERAAVTARVRRSDISATISRT